MYRPHIGLMKQKLRWEEKLKTFGHELFVLATIAPPDAKFITAANEYNTKNEDNLKNEDNTQQYETLKKGDKLKYEDDLKN